MKSNDQLEIGDVISNGFYDLCLTSTPAQTEDGRWKARAVRWVPSLRGWQHKPRTYGWQGEPQKPSRPRTPPAWVRA